MSSTKRPPAHRAQRGLGRRRGDLARRRIATAIAAAAVVIAGGSATAIAVQLAKDSPADPTTVVSTNTAPTPTATSTPDGESTGPGSTMSPALAKCRRTVTAAEEAVAAARTGAEHWSIHTQARTDFLDHKITLEQTNAEFERSKLAGPTDKEAFAEALAAYEKVEDGCADLATSDDAAATSCAIKATALAATVSAGKDVMKDWTGHLNNMALHAENEMNATQARLAWVSAWKAAPKNLKAFAKADTASAQTPACTG